MIKRQSVRLSSLISSDHHHHWACRLMAAATSSSLMVGNHDLLIFFSSSNSKGLHALNPPRTSTDRFQFLSLGKVSLSSWFDTISTPGPGGNNIYSLRRINGRCINCGLTLRLKGCSCCCNNRGDGLLRKSADNNNSSTDCNNALRKARAFAPCLPHLLRDSDDEIGREEDIRDDGKLFNEGGGANHRGSSLGFPDRSLPEKVVVAVDVDEVLGNFVSALNRFIADRYSLNHSVSEYHVYEFFKIWNCSRDEADIRVHEFFKTSYFKTGIHPIPGAQLALQKLSRFCNLSVVTSRQNAIKDHTIEWIEKHYPGLFKEIHFGNHFALDGQSRPKSDICRSLGATVLIDDNPRYAIECAEIGIRVLLFDYENSYPWCKTESVTRHPLVTKVHNWQEVEHQLVSWVQTKEN